MLLKLQFESDAHASLDGDREGSPIFSQEDTFTYMSADVLPSLSIICL